MGITAILSSIFGERGITGTVVDIVKEYHLSPEAEAKIQAAVAEREIEIMKLSMQHDSEQNEINKIEAAHTSIFIAGWRPFVGWACGSAFAYTFVIQPFMIFVMVACGVQIPLDSLPRLDWTTLSTVLFGILGLGYLRTQEKVAAGIGANGH